MFAGLRNIPDNNRIPNHFVKKGEEVQEPKPPEDSNVHIGLSLKGGNGSSAQGLVYLYNDVQLRILQNQSYLWKTDGIPYQRTPVNFYGFANIEDVGDYIKRLEELRKKQIKNPRNLGSEILIIGKSDDVKKIISSIANEEEQNENSRFIQAMIELSELHFNETPEVWLDVIDYLEEHAHLKDCGISTLTQKVTGLNGLQHQFSSKHTILSRFRHILEG